MKMRLMLVAAALLMTTACGYRGGLERPPPIWGEDRAEYDAQQKAKAEQAQKDAEAKAARQQQQTVTLPPPAQPTPPRPQ